MVIATKPKPRQTIHHKRRNGQHQSHTKHFAKTYWPYLPMIGLTALFNGMIAQSSALTTAASAVPEQTTRLQVWTGSSLAVAIALAVAVVCAIIFVTRHALAWQKAIAHGEDYVLHHQHHMLLDLVLVSVVLAGVVATRLV
jgi:hypothetical protein